MKTFVNTNSVITNTLNAVINTITDTKDITVFSDEFTRNELIKNHNFNYHTDNTAGTMYRRKDNMNIFICKKGFILEDITSSCEGYYSICPNGDKIDEIGYNLTDLMLEHQDGLFIVILREIDYKEFGNEENSSIEKNVKIYPIFSKKTILKLKEKADYWVENWHKRL